jgi:hypothetical protein
VMVRNLGGPSRLTVTLNQFRNLPAGGPATPGSR